MDKGGDRNVESNDSPQILDRGRHQASPASLWGGCVVREDMSYTSPTVGRCGAFFIMDRYQCQ